MEYKYTGIILNKRDVGEMDRIYTMYTLEGGKIRSLAKSVRKPHAKLAASLENITLADITIVRTQGLGKITGSIVENYFPFIKKDCEALLEIFSAMNIFDRFMDLNNPDEEIFNLLREYLESMDECSKNKACDKFAVLRLGFIVKLMEMLGYAIEVASCVSCRNQLLQDQLYFSASHGGVLCGECGRHVDSAMPVRPNVVKMIRLFLRSKVGALVKIKAEKKDCDNAHMLIDDFLKWNM